MADEVHYSSGTDSTSNKRKYNDQTPLPSSIGARQTTGFSAPIGSQSPDSRLNRQIRTIGLSAPIASHRFHNPLSLQIYLILVNR
ncbi:hypothetical protein LOK49_Contig583G00004 [Camellia lanceoleosa]|nr:hypothetical protein LOK49_Contig583G00004 [Camellia lanceoleosa]